jgi:hypothetical protein
MARPAISQDKLSDTLTMSECHDGFWLYDYTQGMNLSMKAKTREAALLEALTYYQRRFKQVDSAYQDLRARVDDFVGQFTEAGEE